MMSWNLVVLLLLFIFFLMIFFLLRRHWVRSHKKIHVEVHCINLPSDDLRKQSIQEYFKDFPYPIQFVDAVDTRNDQWRRYKDQIDPTVFQELEVNIKRKRRLEHHQLTPGAVGCFLSHFKCWDNYLLSPLSLEDSSSVLLVLEDDSRPTPEFMSRFRDIVLKLPKDADMCNLNHIVNQPTNVNNNEFFQLEPTGNFYLMNCYLITRKGILKIKDHYQTYQNGKMYKQIDSYLSELHQKQVLNIYFYKESICPQGYFWTNIQTLPM